MKVTLTAVGPRELGNDGIELEVYGNNDAYLGDLRIGKATIEWCKGRTRRGNGVRVGWDELIQWFERPSE